MPNYFRLTPKAAGLPTEFAAVDDLIRTAFGAPPDPAKYFRGWYDGFSPFLAMGWSFERIRREAMTVGDDGNSYRQTAELLDFMHARWGVEAWYSPR